MDIRSLNQEQLAGLNRIAGDTARFYTRVLARMEAKAWRRDCDAYRQAEYIRDTARALAKLTHEELQNRRDTLHLYSKKRAAGQLYRIQRRDRWEQGF